jgi:hypothetical protein
MTDLALLLQLNAKPGRRAGWLIRLRYLLVARSRLARRRRHCRHIRPSANDWMLALPQSRHGG